MSNQEEDVFKEVLVKVGFALDNEFLVPQAVVNHYSIKGRDGIRCVLKEILDEKIKNAKRIDKEILTDVDDRDPSRWRIPEVTCNLYGIKRGNHLRLLIKEIISYRY